MLEAALSNLDEYQLHTPYQEGSWTVHQVVSSSCRCPFECLYQIETGAYRK